MPNEPARILIADDYDTGRAVLSLHLRNCGYEVEEACTGPEALEKARTGTFDLLLLDVEMPHMNGFEVLRALREDLDQTELPVIVISARDESPDVVKAFEVGANDYVTKPIDLAITEARIRSQLARRPGAAPVTHVEVETDPDEIAAMEEEASGETIAALQPGTRLGHYLLDGVLGKGGMGTVYEALNEHLDRRAALKILPLDFQENADALARFRREARLAAKIEHPNVVSVYDVGKWRGRLFLAMQLVRGESAAVRLERDGPFSLSEAFRIIHQTTQGLAAAHELGIIHRDIKPGNILLSGEAVKLADFGLAKPRGRLEEVTTGNRPIGTPEFMSPEQFAEKDLEPPSDIYSLGVTWFIMLTGKAPFHDEETLLDLALAHLHREAPDVRTFVPDVPAATAELIARMLVKDPSKRYPDATALLADLNALGA